MSFHCLIFSSLPSPFIHLCWVQVLWPDSAGCHRAVNARFGPPGDWISPVYMAHWCQVWGHYPATHGWDRCLRGFTPQLGSNNEPYSLFTKASCVCVCVDVSTCRELQLGPTNTHTHAPAQGEHTNTWQMHAGSFITPQTKDTRQL